MSRGHASAPGAARSSNVATQLATDRRPRPRTIPPTDPHASHRSGHRPAASIRPTRPVVPPFPAHASKDSPRSRPRRRWRAPGPPPPHRAATSARCPRQANPSPVSANSTRYAHDAPNESSPLQQYGLRVPRTRRRDSARRSACVPVGKSCLGRGGAGAAGRVGVSGFVGQAAG